MRFLLTETFANDGQSANWGSKLDTNGNQLTWLGYKLHIATDIKAELPVALSITPASTNDGMAESILEECSENLKSKPSYYLMDAGYDQKSIYEIIRKEYKGQAIIPLNHRGAKEPPAGLDWDATPICSAGYRMTYWGAAAMGLTNSDARMLWTNAIVLLVPSGAQTTNYGMVVKTRARQDSGYSRYRIGILQTGNCDTTREPA